MMNLLFSCSSSPIETRAYSSLSMWVSFIFIVSAMSLAVTCLADKNVKTSSCIPARNMNDLYAAEESSLILSGIMNTIRVK